jgi:hypothetical protein
MFYLVIRGLFPSPSPLLSSVNDYYAISRIIPMIKWNYTRI